MTSNNNSYNDVSALVKDIKKEFLFGSIDDEGNKKFLSVLALAEKYNVSYSTLRQNYSSPEKWNDERKDVQKKISKKIQDKKTEHEAEKSIQIDKEYENAFAKLRKKTVKAIDNKKNPRSIDCLNWANALIACYEGEKIANGESMQETSNGLDDFVKSLEESQESGK